MEENKACGHSYFGVNTGLQALDMKALSIKTFIPRPAPKMMQVQGELPIK